MSDHITEEQRKAFEAIVGEDFDLTRNDAGQYVSSETYCTFQGFEIAWSAQSSRIAELEAALNLAVCMLAPYEPGDSRAVSDKFVALAAISCDQPDEDGECMRIITESLSRLRAASTEQIKS